MQTSVYSGDAKLETFGNGPVKAQPPSPIDTAIAHLQRSLQDLEGSVITLEKALQPILSGDYPDKAQPVIAADSSVPLANILHSIAHQYALVNEKVSFIMERVAL